MKVKGFIIQFLIFYINYIIKNVTKIMKTRKILTLLSDITFCTHVNLKL